MTENLADGLAGQISRVHKLIEQYSALGPIGAFGKLMLEADVKYGVDALASQDIDRMIQAYKRLKAWSRSPWL